MSNFSELMKRVDSRENLENRALLFKEPHGRPHPPTMTPVKAHQEPLPTSTFRGPKALKQEDMARIAAREPVAPNAKTWEQSKSEIRNLAIDAVYAKLAQARAETDPEKRLNILVDAQALMTQFLNMGRDPQLAESSRDAVKITLKFYLQEVKKLAPQCQDLTWVQGAGVNPYESYQVLEKLVKQDPSLATTYGPWETRQKALGLR